MAPFRSISLLGSKSWNGDGSRSRPTPWRNRCEANSCRHLRQVQSGKGKTTRPQRPKVSPGSEEESLYVAFGQLLLEDDEDERLNPSRCRILAVGKGPSRLDPGRH